MSMITTRLRQRAAIYRDMARKSFDPTLRREFTHRAERYDTVAWAVEHQPKARDSAIPRQQHDDPEIGPEARRGSELECVAGLGRAVRHG